MSFTLVSSRKKKHKKKLQQDEYIMVYDVLSTSYRDRLMQKVIDVKNEIFSAEIFSTTKSCIEKTLLGLGKTQINQIICYGLGNFSECNISKYQLGLLLSLQEHFACGVQLYDPKFKELEEDLLSSQRCQIISFNEKGKRKVDNTTLFYLPHCPHKLFNNVLCANWGLGLHNCIILGNGVSEVISNNVSSKVKTTLPYLYFISKNLTELEVPNNFKYSNVFNDMCLHYFPTEKLLSADEELWKIVFEEVEDDSLESITETIKNVKLL